MGNYQPGEMVRLVSDPQIQGAIIQVVEAVPEIQYQVFTSTGVQTFYETQLEALPSRKALEIADAPRFRASLTASLIRNPTLSSLYSLYAGHVDFIPHQYRPVLKILRSDRPRILIADGVGVGKTIEAGLILRELQARRDLDSVLVICPRPLVSEHKWEQEMKRFDETFEALDGPRFRYCMKEYDLDGEWPEKYKKTILPYSLFDEANVMGGKQGGGLLSLDPPPAFDLVIVDEAHHVRNTSTYAYQAVKQFCDAAEAVIFLTATPVQLEYDDLFVLLNLLRPDLIIDRDTFHNMARPNAYIGRASALIRGQKNDWKKLAYAEIRQACENTQWGRAVLSRNPAAVHAMETLRKAEVSPEERVGLINALEELHTFSNLISRTRRRDIGEFTVRKAFTKEIPFTAQQQWIHDEILQITHEILSEIHSTENTKFMMTTIRRQMASCLFGLVPMLKDILNRHMEEWIDDGCLSEALFPGNSGLLHERIQEVIQRAESLPPDDPKLDCLLSILRDRQKEPECRVMVFSSFRHTLGYLHEKLSAAGLRVGLIHGDVPDEERRTLRERFERAREAEGALDVLLFSEVGCEGLDYQFCDCMVNYDLPWNPMRIEQRIGRIDRNGQKSESVSIFNLVTPSTVDYDIYQRCMLRIGVFKESVGDCEEILGALSGEVQDIVENFHLTAEERREKLQQLADNKIRLLQERMGLEEKQKDLFTLHLPKQSFEEEVRAAENGWLSPESLSNMVLAYLKERLGENRKYFLAQNTLRFSKDDRAVLLKDFRQCGFPKNTENRTWEKTLRSGGQWISATFDPDNRKDPLLNATHPLVKQAARFLKAEKSVTFLRVETDAVSPGQYPFIVYQWRLSGEREDVQIRPVSANASLNQHLAKLLPECGDGDSPPDSAQWSDEEAAVWNNVSRFHHRLWEQELEAHRERIRELIRYREGSLDSSHHAHMAFLHQQFLNASNDKIRKMREGEIKNAESDYEQRKKELAEARRKADIFSEPLAYGVLRVVATRAHPEETL